MSTLPTRALSIMQPWAWLIVNGFKDIENRDWPTRFCGPVLIHAGKKVDGDAHHDVIRGEHPVTGSSIEAAMHGYVAAVLRRDRGCGGIVGVADIIDCVERSSSPWFVGRYGFVLANARPLPFMPLRGQLGFFSAEYQEPYAAPADIPLITKAGRAG